MPIVTALTKNWARTIQFANLLVLRANLCKKLENNKNIVNRLPDDFPVMVYTMYQFFVKITPSIIIKDMFQIITQDIKLCSYVHIQSSNQSINTNRRRGDKKQPKNLIQVCQLILWPLFRRPRIPRQER